MQLLKAEWLVKPGSRAAGRPERLVCPNLGLRLRTSEKSPGSLQDCWLRRSGNLAGSGQQGGGARAGVEGVRGARPGKMGSAVE